MDEQNKQTAVKTKKKHSFLWLKILAFVVLILGGVVLGLWVSTKDLPVNPTAIIFGESAQSKTSQTDADETEDAQASAAPTAKPEETSSAVVKSTEAPAPAKSTDKPESSSSETNGGKTDETKTTAANGEYIGVDSALDTALAYAGIDKADAQIYGVYRESNDGLTVYVVEFYRDGRSYIYEINAKTAEIEGWKSYPLSDGQHFDERYNGTDGTQETDDFFSALSKEEIYNMYFGGADKKTQSSSESPAPASTSVPKASTSAGSNLPELVSTAFAKEVCFQHAGTKADAVNDLKTELELEKEMLVYEIEFKYNGYKYEYLVDAVNGDIVSSDKEKY